MKEHNIDGKILCGVVIPDYHQMYYHEWKREHLVTRFSMLHMRPPFLKFLCRKEYMDPVYFHIEMSKLDYKIDTEICKDVKASNLAFIVFDKISTAKAVKDLAG